MDDIAFTDWPGQPVDLSSSNPWLPAYGFQHPAALLDKEDFLGNPDGALFLQGGVSSHYVFLETIVEETSDDLRSDNSTCSSLAWLDTDASECASVVHVPAIITSPDSSDGSSSESECACPAKRRRDAAGSPMLSVSAPLSRTSSLVQFETLERHFQDGPSSGDSEGSAYSQDSLERRVTSDGNGDAVGRSSGSSSDDTLRAASLADSCRSVHRLRAARSADSLGGIRKPTACGGVASVAASASTENLSEDSGYGDLVCPYMRNRSSSIPNIKLSEVVLASLPETDVSPQQQQQQQGAARGGFVAYDGESSHTRFACHFGTSCQDLSALVVAVAPLPPRRPLNLASECGVRSNISGAATLAAASEPSLRPHTSLAMHRQQQRAVAGNTAANNNNNYYCNAPRRQASTEGRWCYGGDGADGDKDGGASSVGTDTIREAIRRLSKEQNDRWEPTPPWRRNVFESTEPRDEEEVTLSPSEEAHQEMVWQRNVSGRMTADVQDFLRAEGDSSSGWNVLDQTFTVERQQEVQVKRLPLAEPELSEDEPEECGAYREPSADILDVEARIQKAVSASSVRSFDSDAERLEMMFGGVPLGRRAVTSTPDLKSSLVDGGGAGGSGMRRALSGSASRGVHFCPVVSEVSWRDHSSSLEGSSSDDLQGSSDSSSSGGASSSSSSNSVSDLGGRSPPRDRVSCSQPQLAEAETVEDETGFAFPPLTPGKYASSPDVRGARRKRPSSPPPPAPTRKSPEAEQKLQNSKKQQEEQRHPAATSEEVLFPCARRVCERDAPPFQQRHVTIPVPPPSPPSTAAAAATAVPTAGTPLPSQSSEQSARAMDAVKTTKASRDKSSKAAKFGGFLSRFASFRFSARKSKKRDVASEKESDGAEGGRRVVSEVPRVSPEYIYIPLKDPASKPPLPTQARIPIDRSGGGGGNNNNNTTGSAGRPVAVAVRSAGGASVATPRAHVASSVSNVISASVGGDSDGGGASDDGGASPAALEKSGRARRRTGGRDDDDDDGCLLRRHQAARMERMGLIETDLDTHVTVISAGGPNPGGGGGGVKARSLMNLGTATGVVATHRHHHQQHYNDRLPHQEATLLLSGNGVGPPRPHKSMEFLLDKENLRAVEPPENELQKGITERVMSEHQLRVQRSLQKLTIPDWYKNSQVPKEGFLLKKQRESRWGGGGGGGVSSSNTGVSNVSYSVGVGGPSSKTPSLSSLGSGHSPVLLSPTPASQPFTRWSTSKLNSVASSPCASTRSSFNHHRTSNGGGGVSPCSTRSSFSYRQPYLGWRSQERLARPRTPAERLATSLLPSHNQQPQQQQLDDDQEIQTSIKEVTSAIVHYVSGLRPQQQQQQHRRSLSPGGGGSPGQRSCSPQSRGSQKLCWLESSFVGTRPLDSPQTPLSLGDGTQEMVTAAAAAATAITASDTASPGAASLRLDLCSAASPATNGPCEPPVPAGNSTARPSPGSTTLEDVLDSLLGLPPSTRAPSPNLQVTASASTSPSRLRAGVTAALSISSLCNRRRRSEGSDPFNSCGAVATVPAGQDDTEANGEISRRRRVSFHGGQTEDRGSSIATAVIGTTAATVIKCRYTRCGKVSTRHSDTGRAYKSCHNCAYVYCSRECRRAHWDRHRSACLFSRVGALCRRVLAAAKQHHDTLRQLSALARSGHLTHGAGAVKCFFSGPDSAEKFVAGNAKAIGEPVYVRLADLQPSEMGPNLYADLVKMCRTYNPETRFVLYVSVCVVSEVPATGAVKWERQLVSRCAKIRLSKEEEAETIMPPVSRQDEEMEDHSPVEPVAPTSPSAPHHLPQEREASFANVQRQLRQHGVSLRKQYPDVYQRLCAYAQGRSDRFTPVTMYPRDTHTGATFMCVIFPEPTRPHRLRLRLTAPEEQQLDTKE